MDFIEFIKSIKAETWKRYALYLIVALFLVIMFPHAATFRIESELMDTIFHGTFMKVVQTILFIILAALPIYKKGVDEGVFNKNKSGKKYGDQGSSQEGKVSDLKRLMGDDGFTVSRNFRMSAEASYEHIAVIGPTGAGKSSTFFIPSLLDLDGSHSVVVTDPKGELYDITSGYLKSQGYNIIKLSPLELEENQRNYNPLLATTSDREVREMAQLIMINGAKGIELSTGSSSNNSDWINMSIPLLSAALLYVKEKGEERTISEALQIILRDDLEEMESKFEQVPSAYNSYLIFKSSSQAEKTMSSIKLTLATNMQLFIDENVVEFTQTPFVLNVMNQKVVNKNKMFDPITLREKPTALFICVEETKSTYMMPLMSVLYTQIINKCMDNNTGYPVLFMLDEFANIGVIPTMPEILATARSRRVGISIGIQGIEQLVRNYGQENSANMLNNLKTKLVYGELTGDSANYISELSGFTTVESKSISDDNSSESFFGGKNVTKSGVRRELLTADEIRTLDENYVIIIAHNINLVKDLKNHYYTQDRYMNKIKEN